MNVEILIEANVIVTQKIPLSETSRGQSNQAQQAIAIPAVVQYEKHTGHVNKLAKKCPLGKRTSNRSRHHSKIFSSVTVVDNSEPASGMIPNQKRMAKVMSVM
jgi:hypothetical protein